MISVILRRNIFKPKQKEKTKSVTGIVKALDLEKHRFKIESTYGDETKIISCDFDKKYEDYMVDNFNKEILIFGVVY